MRLPHGTPQMPGLLRKGIALVIVLSTLVLVTVLVLAFLNSISTELQSSKDYASGSSVKLLTQSAVDLVTAEIRDATADPYLCWTSQPGMIRTFDDTGYNSGTHTRYYKLYSDSNMTGTGAFDESSPANSVPQRWYNQKGIYVDLNQPISLGGVDHFPILNGNAADMENISSPAGAKGYAPAANGKSAVAGFYLKDAPVDPQSANHAPMPVKWLYVLRNGEMIAPETRPGSDSVTTTVTFPKTDPITGTPLPVPTEANPIVGRVAFWTDDESCKVNINTAAEAANPWDIPRLNTNYDRLVLSLNQPIQHEFQRYPGHPATVCLSSVLGAWLPVPASWSAVTAVKYGSQLAPYYSIAPRIVAGMGEDVSAGVAGTTPAGMSSQGGSKAPGAGSPVLTPDTDRLYESIDELIFRPNRTVNEAAIDQNVLGKVKFFITAHSRAPDVNLFNQPRVCIWPISANQNTGSAMYRSPSDSLIAYCSQLGKDPNNIPLSYYFQRMDPNDQFRDLPENAAFTGVGRNRTLLEYLRNLTNRKIPGFGGSLADKYSATDALGSGTGIDAKTTERDQILTEIFDYIRSTNTRDQSLAINTTNPVTPYTVEFNTNYRAGTGQVVPIQDRRNGTRGFGRFPTLQQAALIFYVSDDTRVAPLQPSQVKAFFVLSLFDPSMGYPYSVPWYAIKISGLSNFTWDGATPMFPASTNPDPATVTPFAGAINQDPMLGGTVSFRRVMYNHLNGSSSSLANFFSQPYPALNPTRASLASLGISGIRFRGGPITISFYKTLPSGPVNATTKGVIDESVPPIQTITLNFPDAPADGFPLPGFSPEPSTVGSSLASHAPSMSGSTHNPNWESWANRFAFFTSNSINFGYNTIVSDNDTIRSVLATPGDLRLAAARQIIPNATAGDSFFRPHPAYYNAVRMAHNLQSSFGNPVYLASVTASNTNPGGKLVPVNYDGSSNSFPVPYWQCNEEYKSFTTWAPRWPDVPSTTGVFVGGAGSVAGDWDNGIANFKDGAYINKADEGDYQPLGSNNNNYPYYTVFGGASKAIGQTFFSPNRMLPSAGMFGSLPTGVLAMKPWQTLLFRPGPAGHPGLGTQVDQSALPGPPYTTPPDSALLDLFSIPVVEPYAISEPLSTAGRVNMNYRILPFTYIARNTGIQAALRSVQMLAVPNSSSAIYKYNPVSYATDPNGSNTYRFGLNIASTLSQFEARFANHDVFRAPAEICSIDLVPDDPNAPSLPITRSKMDAYWNSRALTGDNSRERPYANLYPLLTTRSNTFTIHFRAQSLQPVRGSAPDEWREGIDAVTGEYRGSQTIERYVDPADSLPDYAGADPATAVRPLSDYYKFRILSVKQFSP